MSNTRRPNAARQHTRTTKEARDTDLNAGIKITVEGESYEVRIGDITPALARELRATVGYGTSKLMELTTTDPDIDVISTFVWLARRMAGEQVDIDDVAVGYGALLSEGFEVDQVGAIEGDGDDPEA